MKVSFFQVTKYFLGCFLFVISFSVLSKTTIRIANLEIAPFLPVAFMEKLASKYDLELKYTNFRRGLEAAQALKSGEVDVAVGGVEAAISAISGGMPAVLISGVSTGGIAWVSQPDQDIKSVKDLKGKKFAVIAGLHELVMRVEFEKYGLSMSTEPGKADVQVFFINSPPALINAMKSKSVDAMSGPEPVPSQAINLKVAKPMLRPYDTVLGNIPRGIFMSKEYYSKNKEAASRFVSALVEATKMLRDNPKLAKEFALNEALKDGMTSEDWNLTASNMAFDISLTETQIQAYIEYMLKYGMIKSNLKVNEITDLSMLEKAKVTHKW